MKDMSFFKRGPTVWEVVNKGDLATLKKLVSASPSIVREKSDDGSELLHAAAYRGHEHVADYLVSMGADVNAENAKGTRPLHWAAEQGHIGVAACLIKHRALVDVSGSQSWTPLELAVLRGRVKMVDLLLMSGANANRAGTGTFRQAPPLFFAARHGNIPVAEVLVSHKAEVDSTDNFGVTPLHEAVAMGQWQFARYLTDKGAKINVRTTREMPIVSDDPRAGTTVTLSLVIPAGSTAMDVLFGVMYEFRARENEWQETLAFLRAHGAKYGSEV